MASVKQLTFTRRPTAYVRGAAPGVSRGRRSIEAGYGDDQLLEPGLVAHRAWCALTGGAAAAWAVGTASCVAYNQGVSAETAPFFRLRQKRARSRGSPG